MALVAAAAVVPAPARVDRAEPLNSSREIVVNAGRKARVIILVGLYFVPRRVTN